IYGFAGATASKIAIEKKKVVFLLFQIDSQPDMFMVTARTHRDINVDLNKVMSKIGGGGHKYAAAGRIPARKEDVVVKLAEDL
ncbi:MAG: DHHA1 domain-containing protein, partial [Candidatus Syntropharchaeia archaeon]